MSIWQVQLGYGWGCNMVWTFLQGYLSTLPAFPPKQVWQVQTMSEVKGLSPDLDKGTSSLWVLQLSGLHTGGVKELPTPRLKMCSPHLPARSCFSPEHKGVGWEATCPLFNPRFSSWHDLHILAPVTIPRSSLGICSQGT